jgi:hypothetical protein
MTLEMTLDAKDFRGRLVGGSDTSPLEDSPRDASTGLINRQGLPRQRDPARSPGLAGPLGAVRLVVTLKGLHADVRTLPGQREQRTDDHQSRAERHFP